MGTELFPLPYFKKNTNEMTPAIIDPNFRNSFAMSFSIPIWMGNVLIAFSSRRLSRNTLYKTPKGHIIILSR